MMIGLMILTIEFLYSRGRHLTGRKVHMKSKNRRDTPSEVVKAGAAFIQKEVRIQSVPGVPSVLMKRK